MKKLFSIFFVLALMWSGNAWAQADEFTWAQGDQFTNVYLNNSNTRRCDTYRWKASSSYWVKLGFFHLKANAVNYTTPNNGTWVFPNKGEYTIQKITSTTVNSNVATAYDSKISNTWVESYITYNGSTCWYLYTTGTRKVYIKEGVDGPYIEIPTTIDYYSGGNTGNNDGIFIGSPAVYSTVSVKTDDNTTTKGTVSYAVKSGYVYTVDGNYCKHWKNGSTYTLTATPKTGYHFVCWKKGSTQISTNPTTDVTITGNATYMAYFEQDAATKYMITTAVNNNSWGSVTAGGEKSEGSNFTITATPASLAYGFVKWQKNGADFAENTVNPITVTVTGEATYTAIFEHLPEGVITVTANPTYGTATGSGSYERGTSVNISATPNSGYRFAQWDDGDTNNPRTITVTGNKTYTAQFYDLNQPLLASFSWEDDDIVVQNYGDGDSYCNSFYAPYGKYFRNLFAKTNSRSSKNFFHLCIQTAQTQSWPGVTWAKIGTYPVQVPGYETNWCGSNLYWYWTLANTDVCVAYAYDSYNLGLNELGTYLCDKTGSDDEDHSDESNYISVGDGLTCKIEVGKNGNPYIRLVRNSDQQCMVSVGEAAVKHTVTITPATNGTITVKDGETTINSGDKVIEGTTLTVTTTPATGYHFDSWTNNGAASVTVNSDVTIGATFAINTYTVTVAKNNNGYGTLTEESDNVRVINNVPYGTVITTGTGENANKVTINGTTVTATPAANDAQYSYAFSGWTNGAATVTDAMTVTANFTRIVNTYDITFKNADGTTLKKSDGTTDAVYSVAYGETPAYDGATPTKAADSEYTYTFNAWTPAIATVTTAATYTATYSTTKVQYTLAWDVNGGNELTGTYTSGTIDWGTAIEKPANPTKAGYTFAGWDSNNDGTADDVAATMPTNNVTYKALWTAASPNITLCEDCENSHYNTFRATYGGSAGVGVNVTYKRQFTASRWSTMCLPFSLDLATMIANKMYGCVYEFKYATGNANVGSGVNLYFSNAKSIEAGTCYIVNANSALAEKTSFVFSGVTIDLSKDNGADLSSPATPEASVAAYNALPGYKSEGTIELVGTLRNGILMGTATGNKYMGLKENKIYYPNTGTGSTIWAYRGIFRSTSALNVEKMRIVVDGEDKGEIRIDNGELIIDNGSPVRKFIRNGNLYIEREGVIYDAQGKRVE